MPSDIDVRDVLQLARAAAHAGARVIGQELKPDGVQTKSAPGDVVSHLDVAAEREIRRIIDAQRPDDLVVGEELAESGTADAALRWSIDPLDGTSNRVKGSPYYATSIGVQSLDDGAWLVGVVHAPELGREYYAVRGAGAWIETRGIRRRATGPAADPGVRLLGTGFSYDLAMREGQFAAIPELMQGFDDLRSFGSAALGLCCVAEGSVDAFVETDLYEHDWAAGALIAEEAGATVVRPPAFRGAINAFF